jgi:hypothetical protein
VCALGKSALLESEIKKWSNSCWVSINKKYFLKDNESLENYWNDFKSAHAYPSNIEVLLQLIEKFKKRFLKI